MIQLTLNGVELERLPGAYRLRAQGEGVFLNLHQLLSLKLLLEAVLGALALDMGGKQLSMINHPDGREELILR